MAKLKELKIVLLSATVLSHVTWTCSRSIQKRSVFQLCSLITFYTQESCLTVNDYGCFCGLGQNGASPLDNIDRCCYEHDLCYGELDTCFWYLPQLTHYWYNCDSNSKSCICTGNWSCAGKVCECDLQFAKCLKEAFAHTHFNGKYKNYNISQCVDGNVDINP